MRTRVKICGITRTEDALASLSFGADAIGFVFGSKAREISRLSKQSSSQKAYLHL